jgi:hypothetical protein
MTHKEIKKIFDDRLANLLLNDIESKNNIKATKKSIKFTSSKYDGTNGEILFDYLAGSKAYYFGMMFSSLEFPRFLKEFPPPYASNHPSDLGYDFSMNTLMEKRGEFARQDGKILLANNLEQISNSIEHIKICLNNFYIPMAERFTDFSPELINDIVKNPSYYSYPLPLIVFCLKNNSLGRDMINEVGNLGKEIIKNKAFDQTLIDRVLSDNQS